MVKFFKTIEKIVKKYSETELTEWTYDGYFGEVRISANPYEAQVWGVISELEFVDGITRIELHLSENKKYEDDILIVEFTERMKG